VIWPELHAMLAAVAPRPDEPVRPGSADLRAGSAPMPSSVAPGAQTGGSPGADVPLVNRAIIDRLGATLPPALVADFLRRGIENAERACERLGTLSAGAEEVMREAHSLKGTSGSFGLTRICAIASEIETAANEGQDAAESLSCLASAVAATREELRRSGLLPG
jgi:hypothetical protein